MNQISSGKEIKTKKPVLPPLKAKCFYMKNRVGIRKGKALYKGRKCGKAFEIKYSRFTGGHVKRNDWSYWTEKEEDKGKYICNPCLIKLYNVHKYTFWENVRNEKKRRILRAYIASNSLSL